MAAVAYKLFGTTVRLGRPARPHVAEVDALVRQAKRGRVATAICRVGASFDLSRGNLEAVGDVHVPTDQPTVIRRDHRRNGAAPVAFNVCMTPTASAPKPRPNVASHDIGERPPGHCGNPLDRLRLELRSRASRDETLTGRTTNFPGRDRIGLAEIGQVCDFWNAVDDDATHGECGSEMSILRARREASYRALASKTLVLRTIKPKSERAAPRPGKPSPACARGDG